MKNQSMQAQAKSKTDTAASQQNAAGLNGASVAPPSYGIDFFDRLNHSSGLQGSVVRDTPRGTEQVTESTNTSAVAGLQPGVEEGRYIGGRTVGEFIGDVARPVGTAVGNVVGSVAGALTGISISSNTNTGPIWNNHGQFVWKVGFSTTGKNGWIVQKIVNTMRAQDAAGSPLPVAQLTPEYWEAWAVDGSSNITPNVGADNDYWIRTSKGSGTQGHWSMTGSVYFTTTDPATQSFTPGGVANAGILLSTTSAPSGLGVARLHRYAQGTWDSTGLVPTHTGSAS